MALACTWFCCKLCRFQKRCFFKKGCP